MNNILLKYLLVFFISMVPLIELRGAVPIGLSSLLGDPISVLPLYAICIIGNMLPVPIIFFFARKVLVWGADKKVIGKFFRFCLEKGEKAGKSLQAKAGRGLYVALFIFVGIPLPGTGAWTGTLAASLLDMDFKKSVLAIMAGVVLAGIIMGLASMGVFGAFGAILGRNKLKKIAFETDTITQKHFSYLFKCYFLFCRFQTQIYKIINYYFYYCNYRNC